MLRTLVRKLGIARARDLRVAGILPGQIADLVQARVLERVGRGLYRLPDGKPTELHSLAIVGRHAPRSVICLLSALRIHNLTSQAAYEVWLALDHGARAPKLEYPPLRIIRMSGKSLTTAIETRDVEGVPIRVFSAAKTVADCFKYRNKLGLDVAIEALRDYRRRFRGGMDELWRCAKACRVDRVLRPYLDAGS